MGLQGLDRAAAPPAATARKMLDAIGGKWWNVYIGGPESGGQGWTRAVVEEYARHGVARFMLTYVGRQWNGPLTRAQGEADAADALRLARGFGYAGAFPLCLDVELRTFESAPARTVEYTRAWCAAVAAAGARPGVYANPVTFKAMAAGKVPAAFAWVASWVDHGATPHDPHRITGMPDDLWAGAGQRAWQYAGAFGGKPCRVLGLDVDINVADAECLAPPPGRVAPPARAARRALRRGDRGDAVERLTRRLAYVRLLDRPRRVFDGDTEAAVARFQREHGLEPSGRYGPRTTRRLAHAVAAERERRAHPAAGPLTRMAEVAREADHREDAATEQLITYALRRRAALEQARAARGQAAPALLQRIAGVLERIEADVEALRGAPAAPVVTEMAPLPPPPEEGPVARTEQQLAALIRAHDEAGDAARRALVARVARIDAALARPRPARPSRPARPARPTRPASEPPGERTPGRRHDGDLRLGDEAWRVRGSKLALARFLAAKGTGEHRALRRRLAREARTRGTGGTATRTWQQGVRAAQHILRLPVTGVMDVALQERLTAFWPADPALRRLLRSGPGWRLIKGQISPNFNLRELSCKDGTPYIAGLVREQGLSEAQARQRAKALAARLERVRKAGGDRRLVLSSVFRTRAHNAATAGAATNSAHLRGLAADMLRPAGVPLPQHKANVRAAFEGGVGYYPAGDFVHGDFDGGLGRREWAGP